MTRAKPKAIDQIKDLLATQGADGNWDYDPYMLGLYNGLELARSVVEDGGQVPPQFREKPAEGWRRDRAADPGFGGVDPVPASSAALEEAQDVL